MSISPSRNSVKAIAIHKVTICEKKTQQQSRRKKKESCEVLLCFTALKAELNTMHRFLHSLVYFAESMSFCPEILLKTILKEKVVVLFLHTHLCIFLQYTCNHIVSINRSLAFSILRVAFCSKFKSEN